MINYSGISNYFNEAGSNMGQGGMLHTGRGQIGQAGPITSDLSNDSSTPNGYPDFPPSPDSWLGESTVTHY